MKKETRHLFSCETIIIIVAFLLSLSGLLTILSGSGTWSSPMEPVIRQLVHLGVALIFLAIAHYLPFPLLSGARIVWFSTGCFWLFLALLGIFGSRINGMQGWYRFGMLSLQPAEIAKGAYLAALCAALTQEDPRRRLPLALLVAVVWVTPIILQPDFTTALIYAAIFWMLLFLAGGRVVSMLLLLATVCAAGSFYVFSRPYAWRRIAGFFADGTAGAHWHVMQFELTVSRGGWFGSRLGKAVWSNAYLPLAYNDSAYATLSETLGFAGSCVIWIFVIVLIVQFLKLASRRNLAPVSRLYIEGTALWIALQWLIHVSVNLALLPPTGLTLPFISYGGSSLVGFFLMTGWSLAASRETEEISAPVLHD